MEVKAPLLFPAKTVASALSYCTSKNWLHMMEMLKLPSLRIIPSKGEGELTQENE